MRERVCVRERVEESYMSSLGSKSQWQTDGALGYITASLFFTLSLIPAICFSHFCGTALEDGRSNQEVVVNLALICLGDRWPRVGRVNRIDIGRYSSCLPI